MTDRSPKTISKKFLPESFRPLLWSYDFKNVNPDENKKLIIINAINYGNLSHWKWLARYYGKGAVKEILEKSLASEIRPQARKLASIIFLTKKFNYAPRSVK